MSLRDTSDKPAKLLEPTLKTESEYAEALMAFFALHRIARPYDVMNAFPQFFTYHNQTMRHLNWLANREYLRRHDDADGYVFNITNTGYERCRDFDSTDLSRIPYHYDEPSGKQSPHELLITKTAVSNYEYVREHSDVVILEEGRFMLQKYAWRDEESAETIYPFDELIPDYWYVSRDGNGLMVRLVEVFVGEESGTNIRRKIEECERWGQREDVQRFLVGLYRKYGATQPVPEYQLHCILESTSWKHTDAWKERMTMMQTFHVNPMMQARVWTTTKEALEAALTEGLNINEPIWHRGKDLIGQRRTQWERASGGHRTRLFDQYMRRMQTYPLFA